MRRRIELLNMNQTAWFWSPVAQPLLVICHIIFSYSPWVFSITFIESHYSLLTTGLSLLLSTSSKPSLPTCRSDMKPSDVDGASLAFPPVNKWMCVCVLTLQTSGTLKPDLWWCTSTEAPTWKALGTWWMAACSPAMEMLWLSRSTTGSEY